MKCNEAKIIESLFFVFKFHFQSLFMNDINPKQGPNL